MTGRHRRTGSSARTGRRWALAAIGLLTVAICGAATTLSLSGSAHLPIGSTPSDGAPDRAGPMAFGVLGSTCDPDRMSALHSAGVRYVEVGVDWSSFEPRQGSFDHGYQSEVKRSVEACRRAGIGVVLTLGLNSAPGWTTDLPAGAYVNQDGRRGPDDVPNVVFGAAVRSAVNDYLAELDRVVGLNSLAAIRVGTGNNGELGYPSAGDETSNPYWAFDTAAQDGEGLAEGMSVSPMPGWTPGSATWEGAAVPTADVQTWFRWYSGSVADAVVWVVHQLRGLGYTRDIHLPLAGRGALPDDLQEALAAHLDGTDERDGSLRSGLYYPEQLQRISQALAKTEKAGWGTVSVDSTSVDDSTAVSARQLDPPQDRCRPDDATSVLLSAAQVADWSSFRWTVANARAAGLGVVGENPGSPDLAETGGDDDTDSSEQQMVHAPGYAQECGMTLFQWAFEDDLFSDGQAGLGAYAEQQRALEDQGRPGSSGSDRAEDGE